MQHFTALKTKNKVYKPALHPLSKLVQNNLHCQTHDIFSSSPSQTHGAIDSNVLLHEV